MVEKCRIYIHLVLLCRMAELPCIEPKDLEKYMRRYFKKNSNTCKEFSILVVGETGSGKSTLVNNLLGEDVTPVGDSVESKTSEIVKLRGVVKGVPVLLYDTPGLGDSRTNHDEKILADMKKVLDSYEIHVVIYCFKISETRLRDSLVRIFQEYDKLGVDWKRTVIALTFSDALPQPRVAKKAAMEKGTKIEMKTFFNEKVREWETCLGKLIREKFKVNQVKIRPTTDTIEALLPNGERWYVPFWLDVLEILNPGAKVAFLEMHQQKIRDEGESGLQLTDEELSRLQRILFMEVLVFQGTENPELYIIRVPLGKFITLMVLGSILANLEERMDSDDKN